MPFNSFWGMNMNTSENGIARTHETDALDLSTMTKHEMPYGIDAIAEIRMSTPADYPAIIPLRRSRLCSGVLQVHWMHPR